MALETIIQKRGISIIGSAGVRGFSAEFLADGVGPGVEA